MELFSLKSLKNTVFQGIKGEVVIHFNSNLRNLAALAFPIQNKQTIPKKIKSRYVIISLLPSFLLGLEDSGYCLWHNNNSITVW